MPHTWIYLTNWETHIHYRDRGAAWIKAHVADLNDYQWIRLPDAVKGQLTALRYLAARGEGKVPDDPAFLAAQCGCTEPLQLEKLIEAGFLTRTPPVASASTMLAKGYPQRKKERNKLGADSAGASSGSIPAEDQEQADAIANKHLDDLERRRQAALARRGVS